MKALACITGDETDRGKASLEDRVQPGMTVGRRFAEQPVKALLAPLQ